MKKMTSKKIKTEVKDLIQRSDSVPIILRHLVRIACPQHRIAMAEELKRQWHILEEQGDEKAIYQTANGQYTLIWPEADNTINHIIQETEEETTTEPAEPADPTTIDQQTNNTQTTTKTPTTMPIIVHKQEGTIHNYDHCTIYTTAPVTTSRTQNQEIEVVDVQAIPAFFRTDSQSISEIEKRWNKALEENTKTKVIRAVMQQDYNNGYFRLANLTNQERAEEFNKAQNKFVFNASDFENANRK